MEPKLTKTVRVDLSEVIDNDFERFLDILADRVGEPMLTDIEYEIVGHERHALLIKVSGVPYSD